MKPDISAVLFIDDCYIDILPILSLFFISFVMVHFIIMIYRFPQSEYEQFGYFGLGIGNFDWDGSYHILRALRLHNAHYIGFLSFTQGQMNNKLFIENKIE